MFSVCLHFYSVRKKLVKECLKICCNENNCFFLTFRTTQEKKGIVKKNWLWKKNCSAKISFLFCFVFATPSRKLKTEGWLSTVCFNDLGKLHYGLWLFDFKIEPIFDTSQASTKQRFILKVENIDWKIIISLPKI